MTNEPFGSVEFDHIAIGVADDAVVAPLLEETLGGSPYRAGPGRGFRWWQWEYAGGGRIEILRPDGPPGGFLHRFLERRGAGLHHVTFKVPQLLTATERARDLGFDIIGFDDSDPTWKEAFIHPRQAGGIVVQLAEEHTVPAPSVRSLSYKPKKLRDAVTLVGLRFTAPDVECGRRLWGDLLCGHLRSNGQEVTYEWPGSPLRIAIEIDSAQSQSPIGIEIATESVAVPPNLLNEPDPALGARFIRVERT